MFESIARLFGQGARPSDGPLDARTAVAALLVHLAAVDGEAGTDEFRMIGAALRDHYGLSEAEVKRLVEEAQRRDREAVDFYQFTAALARLEEAEKRDIIRMMWQVVFVDDDNHELEDNMVWRVAELIGVSTRDRTLLRNAIRLGTQGQCETDSA